MSQPARVGAQHALRNTMAIHSSSATRAAALAIPPLPIPLSIPAVTLPPMLDIFDVPHRLVRRRETKLTMTPAPPRNVTASSPAASVVTSLPTPLVFEGPAGRRPIRRSHHELASFAGSGVVTMFDGPAHSGGRREPLSGTRQHRRKQTPTNMGYLVGAATAATFALGVSHS
ncbi:hypothetical protein FB45DRAFT_919899 [Roridomyces roridus]|uniref:Uncharacterized protein n=1 Tax=Roridomyces roridus TaxID=1738132 RepID=A0AAD7BS86_9AGAR|nr:hypothetical protein FB45DRAFT_919899 [Roridomyces roridus]